MSLKKQKNFVGPLKGLTIFEIGTSVAGPYAGQILADLGARVIKVEKPEGDDARYWGAPYHGDSAVFQALNRKKSSITVDFKDNRQRSQLIALIRDQADIILQNLRPGLLDDVGLGATLCQGKPSLIYCNLGAFGRTGPLSRQPGFDPLMQAFGGIMSTTGEQDRAPVRVGPSVIDFGAGMWAVIGILAAVQRRTFTGQGGVVDTSLFETALSWMSVLAATFRATGVKPGRMGSEMPFLVPYKAFTASDGWLVVAPGNERLYRKFCVALGRQDWIDDPRFATNADRLRHRDLLHEMVDAVMAQKTRAAWEERLVAAGVPCARMQTVDEVLDHPQVHALGIVQTCDEKRFELITSPLSFDGQRSNFGRQPPRLGQDQALLDGSSVSPTTSAEKQAHAR